MTVDFGLYVPQLAFAYDDVVARAKLADELGFTSLWLFDHLYGPMLPDVPSLEGWTLATALATQTTRLRIGHLVLCNQFRHPALLAKMATTLDHVSNGRFDLGLGSGSVEQEHLEAGLPWGSLAERSDRLGEALAVITSMFEHERTTFEGEHYQVRDLPNVPPPVQQPHPPIHIGGIGEQRTIPLVARYADVWNVPTYGLAQLTEKRAVLARACEEAGRDPGSIRSSLESVLVLVGDESELPEALAKAERRFPGEGWGVEAGGFVGTPAQVVDRIGERLDAGFDYFVFITHDRAKEETLRRFADQVMPHFS